MRITRKALIAALDAAEAEGFENVRFEVGVASGVSTSVLHNLMRSKEFYISQDQINSTRYRISRKPFAPRQVRAEDWLADWNIYPFGWPAGQTIDQVVEKIKSAIELAGFDVLGDVKAVVLAKVVQMLDEGKAYYVRDDQLAAAVTAGLLPMERTGHRLAYLGVLAREAYHKELQRLGFADEAALLAYCATPGASQ